MKPNKAPAKEPSAYFSDGHRFTARTQFVRYLVLKIKQANGQIIGLAVNPKRFFLRYQFSYYDRATNRVVYEGNRLGQWVYRAYVKLTGLDGGFHWEWNPYAKRRESIKNGYTMSDGGPL